MTFEELYNEVDTVKKNVLELTRVTRNILNLASQYGFTGFVDIAAHNEDPLAHSTNPNFITASENGHQLVLGTDSDAGAGYSFGTPSTVIGTNTNKTDETNTGNVLVNTRAINTWGDSAATIEDKLTVYSTGSDGSPATAGVVKRTLFKFGVSYVSTGANPDVYGGVLVNTGSIEEASDESSAMRKKVSFLFVGTSGVRGQYRNFLELSHTNILPALGNSMSLGSEVKTFANAYLSTSPSVVSDEREKTDVAAIPEAVLNAWGDVQWVQFRYLESVKAKGDDARKHTGLIAQRIIDAFEKHGLDACEYGVVCHAAWSKQNAVFDGDIEVQPETEAGDRWTVRYDEALALECAYQRWRMDKLEKS